MQFSGFPRGLSYPAEATLVELSLPCMDQITGRGDGGQSCICRVLIRLGYLLEPNAALYHLLLEI